MANDGSVVIGTELDETGFSTGLSGLGSFAVKGLSVVGTAIGVGATAMVALGKASVETGMQFDSAMSQVAATMGVTTDQISDLRQYALDMGSTTAYSATEAAEALNYMALAGYDSEKSMAMLPNVLNLAAAGSMDLASASDMVTDAQSALGLTMGETTQLVDKMAMTASKSNTSVSQLGDAILTVGGTAKVLSGGTTELNQVLGLLADNGIKGSEGGTALRNVLLALTAPTDKAAKAMNELGLEVYDASGNLRPMEDIFTDLNTTLGDMTEGQKTSVLNDIFNKVDLKSVNALLGTNVSRWKELKTSINNADNAAQSMAEIQLDNLAGDVTLFKSALEGAEITLSDTLTPAIRSFVQYGTQEIQKLDKAFQSDGIKGFADQLGETLGDALGKLVETVPEIVEVGASLVGSLVSSLGESIVSNAPTIIRAGLELVETLGTGIVNAIPSIMSGIGELIGAAIINIPKMIEVGATLIAGIAEGIISGIGGLAEGILGGIDGLISGSIGDQTLESKKYLEDLRKDIASFNSETTEDINNSISDIEGKAAAAEKWLEIYDALYQKQDLTASEQQRLNDAVEALNSILPETAQIVQDENGAWSANTAEIQKNIDKMKERAKAQIYAEKNKQILEKIVDLEIQRNEVQKEINEITPLYEQHSAALQDLTTASIELGDALTDVNQGTKDFSEINLSPTTKAWCDANGYVIDSYIDLQDAANAASYAYEQQGDTLKRTVEDERATLSNLQTSLSEINTEIDLLNETYDNFATQAENATQRAETAGYESGINYAEGLKTTAKNAREAGAEVLAAAADGTNDTGALKSAGSAGGEAYAGGVKSTTGSAKAAGQEVLAAAEAGMSGGGFHAIGYGYSSGLAAGIVAGKGLVAAAAAEVLNDTVNRGAYVIQSHSPSKVTEKRLGLPMGQGVAVGLEKSLGELYDVMDTEINGAIDQENRDLQGGNLVSAQMNASAENTPRYVETNIEIDGRAVAKTTTPYISKELAWT